MKIQSMTKTDIFNELLFTLLLASLQDCRAMEEQPFQRFVSRLSENRLKVCKTAPRAIPRRFCRIVESDCQVDRCSNPDLLATYLTIAPCPPRNLLSLLCTMKTNLTCDEKARIFDGCTRKFKYDKSQICRTQGYCASCSEIIELDYFKNTSYTCVGVTSSTITSGPNLPSDIPAGTTTESILVYLNPAADKEGRNFDIVTIAVVFGILVGPIMFLLLYTIFWFRQRKRNQVMRRRTKKQISVASTKPLLDQNGIESTELNRNALLKQDCITSQSVDKIETTRMIDSNEVDIKNEDSKDVVEFKTA